MVRLKTPEDERAEAFRDGAVLLGLIAVMFVTTMAVIVGLSQIF